MATTARRPRRGSGRCVRDANPAHRGDEPYNFFLAVIFPHDQMQILDYNRVVRDLHGREPEAFLGEVRTSFEVTQVASGKPERPRCFGMYLGGQWHPADRQGRHLPDR